MKKKMEYLSPIVQVPKFKKSLTDIGYDIEVLSGPVGKKEMVRATKR